MSNMTPEQKEVLQAMLDREKQLIKDLKFVYGQAQDDTVNKLIDLSRRRDLENIQSVIYQQQYQDILREQIDAALDLLHTNEYATMQDFLTDCYTNGYVGTFYDVAGQGIPLIIPMDHKKIVDAIQIDSKLKASMYTELGEDIKELKKAVRMEVARGVANGSNWNAIAHELSKSMKHTPFDKAYNRSIRIARTEGHRIQTKAALDAQQEAKKNGAKIVKQWDATLDGHTRETHRLLDGQIREIDEDFTVKGMKASAPGYFNDPGEDCNCRCALLQRARAALDEKELEELREKAAFHGALVNDSKAYGHEKAKDFSDYKNKFMKATADQDSDSVQKINEDKEQKYNENHSSIKDEWIKNATPNSHEIIELNEYEIDGKKYVVNGRDVLLDHDAQEKRIAKLLEEKLGGKLCLVPRIVQDKKKQTPDYLFRNEKYDLKTLSKGTSNHAIYNRLKDTKEQADNFVLDITKFNFTEEEIEAQIEEVYWSKHTNHVKNIILVKGDEITEIYTKKE